MANIQKTLIKQSNPPYPWFVLVLVGAVALACILGIISFRHENSMAKEIKTIEDMWDDRAASSSLSNQEITLSNAIEDKQALKNILEKTRGLYGIISVAILALVALALFAFMGFRIFVIKPLHKLEESCRRLSREGLQGHIWGLDRDDQYGALARSIDDVRSSIIRMSDMIVENTDGKSHIQFSGRGAAMFNTLVADMQESLARVNAQGERLEEITRQKESSVHRLDETVHRTTQSLESAVDASRVQLAGLQDEWVGRFTTLSHQHGHIQEQAKNLVGQFSTDMKTMREIATSTSQRVAQMLQNLGRTDHDYKRAAALSLEASQSFSREAQELSEKLNAATTLLRASGKVMSETTESTRAKLVEAVGSVSQHDVALRNFLSEAEDKTTRMTNLFDDMQGHASRVAEVVISFDERMSQFENKSDEAFSRIETGSRTIDDVSAKLGDTHNILDTSLQALSRHTEGLANILTGIRGEYQGFVDNWRETLADATPAIAQLKETSGALHDQLTNEWSLYAQQSRNLLTALEQDVRAMNTRTSQVASDADRLIGNLDGQSKRLADSASHFDLQVASLSQRLEDAAGSVLESNEHVVKLASSQVREIHGSVQDMVQRLSILTQLTGTLGSVAGQLGQIVPTLADMRQMQHAGFPTLTSMGMASGADSDTVLRLEKVADDFGGAISELKDDFVSVRSQISKWVDMLTNGYQQLAAEVGGIDEKLVAQISELKNTLPTGMVGNSANQETFGLILPVIKLVQQNLERGNETDSQILEDIQSLQTGMSSLSTHTKQTGDILQSLGAIMGDGFTRLEKQEITFAVSQTMGEPQPAMQIDTNRLEQTSRALESLMHSMQKQSSSLVEKLGEVTHTLASTSDHLNHQISEASTRVASATAGASGKSLPTDALREQLHSIKSLLDQCAAGTQQLATETPENVNEKSFVLAQNILNAIEQLNGIAASLASNEMPTPQNEAEKAG